jgi:DNA-binding NarL/FixJ family response regulator
MSEQGQFGGVANTDSSTLALAGDRTVLLVEDDEMARSWVRLALERSEFRLVGEAASAGEGAELAERRKPALLLVDQRLPDGTGTELVRALRRRGIAAPAVVMTANRAPGFNELVRDVGAQGSVLKSGSVTELLNALRTVAEGRRVVDTRHPARSPERAALSPREREVLVLVARGLTNRQIAERLDIGSETVKTLIARAFAKLGVRRRAEAVAAAHDRGLL